MNKIYLFSISSHPEAISVNSLEVKLLKPAIDFSNYDYLIITSKQTSLALKQYDTKDYIGKKALCVSVKSAEAFEELGGNVLKVGNGYGDELSSIIKKYPKSTKWLYLRAKVIANEFVKEAKKENYNIDEVIVYESGCSKEILETKVEDESILIFTSPSSVECFLKNNVISDKSKVIVIGKTTAKVLPKNVEYYISKDRTIDSCIELVKNI